MRASRTTQLGLAVAVALCWMELRAWPQSTAPDDKTVQVGDSEAVVRTKMGKPMGSYKTGSRMVLIYGAGEIALENGKVVDVFKKAPPPPPPPKPAVVPSKPAVASRAGTASKPSRTPATNAVPVKVAPPPPPKPDAGHYPTDPNNRDTLVREIPDYGELERDIMDAVSTRGIKATQQDVQEHIHQMWGACFSGGGTALGRLAWEMGRFDAEGAEGMAWDYKDDREKQYNYKFRRGAEWEYGNEPPDGTSTVECWRKRVTGRGTEYHGSYMTIGGAKTDWGKMTWESTLKKWVWSIPSRREVFLAEYEGKLRQEIADWKSKATASSSSRGTPKDVMSLVRTFEPHFRYRYLERFVNDYRAVPWPD